MAKILILTNNSTGLYNFRKDLIERLIKEHEIIAATPFIDKTDELTKIGCRLIETPFKGRGLNPIKDIRLFYLYKKIINVEKPDLVITYTIKPNIYGGMACRLEKKKYVCNITGLGMVFQKKSLLKCLVVCMYRCALKMVSTVFFENTANRDLFVNDKIISQDKTYVLHGAGVNLDKFSYLEYPHNDVFRFTFIGRIMKEKGVFELLQAMNKLNNSGDKCFLDMVGVLPDSIKYITVDYERKGWLHCYGYQKDVRPYIQTCDCFVLPSYHEGMANTNLECASCGRPIITSDIPGCREAVIDGVTGLLCKPHDADSLYKAMKCMMNKTREEREKMGRAGRQHMEGMFDKREVVEETIYKLFA